MKTTRMLMAWLITTLAVVTAACSHKESEILESIPAGSDMIARINCEDILESAGFTRNGEKWEAGKVMSALLDELSSKDRLEFEKYISATQAIDASNVFVYNYEGDMYLTCILTHPDQLAAALEAEFGQPERSNSFKVYRENIMIRDNRLWIAEDVKHLTKVLEIAEKSPATESKSVMATFATDGSAMDISLNPGKFFARNPYMRAMGIDIKELENSHISYKTTLAKNTMKIEAATYDEDGDKIPVGDLVTPIDASFIKFMPAHPALTFAFGKVTDEFMQAILGDVPSMQRSIIEPYLMAVNGTFAISAALPDDVGRFTDPAAWGVTVAVAYDESKAGEILKMAAGLNGNGIIVSTLPDQLRLNFMGANMPDLFIAYKEGYLVASTRPVAGDHTGLKPGNFDKYYAAGTLSIPADGSFGKAVQLPFGVEGHMECENEVMYGFTEFTGSPYGFIESIISLVTDRTLQRHIVEAVAGSSADDYTEWE
ncbi:MAG: hypothetical protein K2L21_01175 [Muribaculaceae bacterium]|nr:hypothetical protein [Muribaculaceae bacterium]